ncbi:MAG: efflux RND transporter periplasmic adaptor subunit [Helicobacteraceae bacterium]|jgi:RND family efflux transporter MFP subunit|nr:efflux RND transporter periplasmic adaptor subunit [Helicobacteraceae bacterium]
MRYFLIFAVVIGAAIAGFFAGRLHAPIAAKLSAEREILYYRNPMGLADTSPTPKKDPMGMDYIPVYKGEEDAQSGVKISIDKIQKMGVRTQKAEYRQIETTVRAAGRIEADERKTYAIAPKFEGYVKRLFVNTTGEIVQKGQPLFEIYSPELLSTRREYELAKEGIRELQNASEEARKNMRLLADSALSRFNNWDIPAKEIETLSNGELIFRSPFSGAVIEKNAIEGMRFEAGETLYTISDLSSTWAIADIFESQIDLIKIGDEARVFIDSYPDKIFGGKIAYIYPTLDEKTRTIKARIELDNAQGLLKPNMFAAIEIKIKSVDRLGVPLSALIDGGVRKIVFAQIGEGRFEPREVQTGRFGDRFVEIASGVSEGETIVVSANFLIDAESSLQAAIDSFNRKTTYKTKGEIVEIDAQTLSAVIAHEAIDELGWSAMTMEFKAADKTTLTGLTAGDHVSFEFEEKSASEWTIVKIAPLSE